MNHQRKSRYRLSYIAALGLIAALVITMKLQLGATRQHMADDSRVINVAGRQRMLSQRIARHALALASAPVSQADRQAERLQSSLDLWVESHGGLVSRDAAMGLSGTNTDAVQGLFADLEPHYSSVVTGCRLLIHEATLPADQRPSNDALDRRANQIGEQADAFLPLMHEIVGEYDKQSSARVEALEAKEFWLTGVILLVLLLEAVLLFEPMLRRLKRYVDQLEEATDAAEHANQIKSEFLANMSHEIRTPMAAIIGYTDLLKQGESEEEQAREFINTIERNSKHLLAIINDVLDMSKIEAGQMAVESIEMSPAHVVEDAVSLIRPKAIGKSLEMHVRYVTAVPALIMSDPTRVRQILINLIGNAIKFTKEGSIAVEIGCDWDAGAITFKVRDTGIGMTAEQLERVSAFRPFTQADTSTTRRFGGTGLGLRISNTLATMLGGGLSVESEHGKGTCFTLKIQAGDLTDAVRIEPEQMSAALHHREEHRQAQREAGMILQGVRILLIEDGVDNQRLIRFHLEKAGAEVAIADNGRIGVDLLAELSPAAQPHVVLMDMQMPEMDGYTATRVLRKRGCTLPVIALTAHAMQGDRELCIEAGCDDYLTKPIDKNQLKQACAVLSSRAAAA